MQKQSMRVVDLTRTLSQAMPVYRAEAYSDPPMLISPWCDIDEQGFSVSKLELGTQTGTHIDAPRHFAKTGDNLDKLTAHNLVGKYELVDIGDKQLDVSNYTVDDANFLFLRFTDKSCLSASNLRQLLDLSPLVWILSGTPQVDNLPLLEFHQRLAYAGKYLVEDIDEKLAKTLQPNGLIVIAPLNIVGVSGSPCRVLCIYQ